MKKNVQYSYLYILITGLFMLLWVNLLHAQSRKSVSVNVPGGSGTYFLQMNADIPARLGSKTIRDSVFVNGKRAAFQPKFDPDIPHNSWNDGYVPYYTVQKRGTSSGKGKVSADLLRLVPVKVPDSDARVTVHPASGYEVRKTRLHPAIKGISASLQFSGKGKAVYFVGRDPKATVTLSGAAGRHLSGRLIMQHLRLADFGANTSTWSQGLREVEAGKPKIIPINVDLGGDGKAKVTAQLPDDQNRLVGVSLVLKQGPKRWAQYLGAAAVVPSRDTNHYDKGGMFMVSAHKDSSNLLNTYKKMGFDWVRIGTNWSSFEPKPGKYNWSRYDKLFNKLRDAKLYAMCMTQVAPDWARPDTAGLRPFKYKNMMWKRDAAPSNAHLDDWQDAYEHFFRRYKDVARAANVWNEPWEGLGITGWKSDGEHYRNLFNGIYRAVRQVDSTIKMVAADVAYNTDWKLFSAGMQDKLDVLSTHYSSAKTDYSFSMANYYDHGMQTWETETWHAWMGDAPDERHVLHYLANGGSKISLFNELMLFDHRGYPTPTVVWTGAMRYMLDGLTFKKVIHPARPPFVLLFSGDKGRQVAAVATTLARYAGQPGSFRRQFASDRVQMHLPGDASDYKLYNLLANPVKKHTDSSGAMSLTVRPEPQYIEFRGSAKAFAQRLRKARIEGLKPAQIIVYDLTGRLGNGNGADASAKMPVILKNTYPTPQTVTVRAKSDGLTFKHNPRRVQLPAAGSNKRLSFAVANGRPQSGNVYRVKVTVTSDDGQTTTHKETVHVAAIGRGTPHIDGRLGDWDSIDAVPVRMQQRVPAGQAKQKIKRSWKTFTANNSSFAAQMAYAYDDNNLYIMARVQDSTRQVLPSLLTGKNRNEMQNPPANYIYIKNLRPVARGDLIQLALGSLKGGEPYIPKYDLRRPGNPLYHMGSYISTQYKYLIYPTKGGGGEVLRMRTPDFYYLHPLPIDYKWLAKHCRVKGAKVKVRRTDDGYIYEAALPWSELKKVPHAPGDRTRLSMSVQDGSGVRSGNSRSVGYRLTWSQGRSAASLNSLDFEPGYSIDWSSETRWSFTR